MIGIVKDVNLEEGSFVMFGIVIVSVVDISCLKMVIKVLEMDIVKVKKGQYVQIIIEVYL